MAVEAREPVFLAYSLTEMFTATLVLKLCDDGALELDDTIGRWIPGPTQRDGRWNVVVRRPPEPDP